jgi:ppGpp synthetase/RelA/SpoT-type nucleotidyltranferase
MNYSKSKVDRAGQLLADRLRLVSEGKATVGEPPREVVDADEAIDWWRSEHAKPLSRVAANLRYYASAQGKPVVAQRLKKLPTIADKLLREPRMKLSRMGDIGGVRAVLPNQDVAYRVASRLRKNWTITRVRDYVAEPKADGYRALHLINRNRGRLIEVQLRTPRQDLWANTVETLARTVAPGLKFADGPQELRSYFVAMGELFALRDQKLRIDSALLDRVEDLQEQASTFIDRAINEP